MRFAHFFKVHSRLGLASLASFLTALTALTTPALATTLPANFDLGIEAAVNDSFAQAPQTGAFYMFGTNGILGSASALVFAANSGRFYSVPNGAVVVGHVVAGSASSTSAAEIYSASRGFDVLMNFTARGNGVTVSPTTGDGSGGPKTELKTSAYLSNSGSIDPNTWSFFDMTSATLSGTDEFAGITVSLTQIPANSEAPFQYGDGASGRNARNGGSMWFDWAITSAGSGILGNVGRSGSGDVYFQTNCANDASTATSMGLAQCSGAVPLPGSAALLVLGLAALGWRTRLSTIKRSNERDARKDSNQF